MGTNRNCPINYRQCITFSEYWCQNWCTLQEMLHHCAADEWSLFVSSSPVSLAVSTMNLMTKWRGTELNLTRVKRYRNWWFIVFLQISSFTRHQASSDCHPQPEIIGDSLYLVCITMPALEFRLFLEHCKMNTYNNIYCKLQIFLSGSGLQIVIT